MWPVLWSHGTTVIYSYPLFIGLAWGLGFRLAERELPATIPPRLFAGWIVGLFLSSWIGAKLLFLVTQNQWSTDELLGAANFWLGGGFVFLGGFLAGGLYSWLVGLFEPRLALQKMQFTIIPLLWSHAVGRLGCFLAGCCYGVLSELPWALKLHGAHRHPVQLYEAVGLILLALGLKRWQNSQRFLAFYLIGYGLLRIAVESWRGDELRGLWFSLSTSQLIAGVMVLLGLGLWRKGQAAEMTR